MNEDDNQHVDITHLFMESKDTGDDPNEPEAPQKSRRFTFPPLPIPDPTGNLEKASQGLFRDPGVWALREVKRAIDRRFNEE